MEEEEAPKHPSQESHNSQPNKEDEEPQTESTPEKLAECTTIENQHTQDNGARVPHARDKRLRKAVTLAGSELTPLQMKRGALRRQKVSLDEGIDPWTKRKDDIKSRKPGDIVEKKEESKPLFCRHDSTQTQTSSFDGSISTIPEDSHQSPRSLKKRGTANGQTGHDHFCSDHNINHHHGHSCLDHKDKTKYIVIEDDSHLRDENCCSENTYCLWCAMLPCKCPPIACCRKRQKPPRRRNLLDPEVSLEKEPLKKRLLRPLFTGVYVVLVLVAIVVTYSMIQDLINSMANPVRSIQQTKVDNYTAPGIAVYPGGAKFLACGHYYNNVVTSKVRLEDLNLIHKNCSSTAIVYQDPHYPGVDREALVIRGPTSFETREAIFIHFALEDETRDFFTVSYFVFPGWDEFNASSVQEKTDKLVDYHRYVPTFALSSGLRMWIKLIMSETYFMDNSKHTEFRVEYSVVKFWDRRPEDLQKRHLFFIFFEWKNNIIEQSYLIYTTTPWSIGAGLCGVFLTLHRGYQLARTSYKRVQKDKERRKIRKKTIREMRRQKSLEAAAAIERYGKELTMEM